MSLTFAIKEMTDYPYKRKIEEAILAYPDKFRVPEGDAREYPLENRCRADFCFRIGLNGFLFVEDDDGARAVNNLVKYWAWMEKNFNEKPCHLIHIIEMSRPAQIVSVRFIADKMEKDLSYFQYHLVTIDNWQIDSEAWLPEVRNIVAEIANKTMDSDA